MSYDLIAFDMDGTLLNSNKKIRQDSIHMINKAVAAGKFVCLSTGRCMPELDEYTEELKNMQYFICNSGAGIWDNKAKKMIYRLSLEKDTVLEIFRRQEAVGLDAMSHILSDKSLVQTDQASDMSYYKIGVYQSMYDTYATHVENLKQYFIDNSPMPVYKFNMYLAHVEERDAFCHGLQDLPITMAYAEYASIECSPKHVSKGSALKELCKILNIPIERSIAVGDSDNDKAILEAAGLGIVMGNGLDRIKAIADVIVRDNDHGGCAQAIEEYLLKEP